VVKAYSPSGFSLYINDNQIVAGVTATGDMTYGGFPVVKGDKVKTTSLPSSYSFVRLYKYRT
jgi:hypothetical protein